MSFTRHATVRPGPSESMSPPVQLPPQISLSRAKDVEPSFLSCSFVQPMSIQCLRCAKSWAHEALPDALHVCRLQWGSLIRRNSGATADICFTKNHVTSVHRYSRIPRGLFCNSTPGSKYSAERRRCLSHSRIMRLTLNSTIKQRTPKTGCKGHTRTIPTSIFPIY